MGRNSGLHVWFFQKSCYYIQVSQANICCAWYKYCLKALHSNPVKWFQKEVNLEKSEGNSHLGSYA